MRTEDFASFHLSSETSGPGAVATGRDGVFRLSHFPRDLRAVVIDLIGTDGARRKFRTPQGDRLTADEMPEVSFEELKTGTARLVLPRGVTVEGVVVNMFDEPVMGATVIEGSQWGNLKVLSRTETDLFGRFELANRPPREIILAASAKGYAGASLVAQLRPGMQELRIQLPPEQPLCGRVVDEAGLPLVQASVTVPDYCNERLGLVWSDKTDPEDDLRGGVLRRMKSP